MSSRLNIPAPLGGLNRGESFTDQPPKTSRKIVNVRTTDPVNGRQRMVSREGLDYFFTNHSTAFGARVQRMENTVVNDRRLSYTYSSQPPAQFATATPGANSSSVVRIDSAGDAYFFDGDTAWVKVNTYGEVLFKQTVETLDPDHRLTGLWVDEELSVYVSTGHKAQANGTIEIPDSTSQGKARIWKWVLNADASGYIPGWGGTPIAFGTPGRMVPDIRVYNDVLYTLQVDWTASPKNSYIVAYQNASGPGVPGADVAGVGVNFIIPHASIWTVAANDRDLVGHSFALRNQSQLEFIVCGTNAGANSGTQCRFLCKLSTMGTVTWKFTDATGDASYQNGTGAIGFGVAVDSTGNIISLGYVSGASGEGVWLRRIIDQGSTASTSATGSWKAPDSFGTIYEYPRFALDQYDNVFAPYNVGGLGSTTPRSVRVFAGRGNTANSQVPGGEIVSAITSDLTYSDNAINTCRSTAVPPFNPPFTPAYLADDIKVAEFVYCAVALTTSVTHGMQKRHLLTSAVVAGSVRDLIDVAVALPDIVIFSRGGITSIPANVVTGNLGGASALTSNASYVSIANLFGDLFFADGVVYRHLDPRGTVADPQGIVTEWTAHDTGIIPPRGRLLFSWRDRVGIGRTPDDEHNFYLSASGNAFDWDFNPFNINLSQALAGSLSGAGFIPDLPNAFVPYNNDLLIVGCDHSLWQVTGSPAKGGEIDRISSITGMSFGKPYCVDPEGRIYFFGSRGGIYVLQLGSLPQRISTDSIDVDLVEIDLSQYYIEMAWDDHPQLLHVFVLPFGGGGTLVQQYTYDRGTGAWIPQKYGIPSNTAVQPVALMVMDGDGPGDRVIVLATESGKLGQMAQRARTVKDDLGMPIYSEVLIGPLVPRSGITSSITPPTTNDQRSRFSTLEVTLTSELSGCGFHVYAPDIPDVLGDPVAGGELAPGFNRVRFRAKGRYVFLRLFNGTAGRRWGFESASVMAVSAGRVRASA